MWQARGIEKRFGGVRALRGVDLDLHPGEVHALCGENGAGKSTLIRILGGLLPHDAGTLAPEPYASVREAEAAGVAVVHQEPLAFPDLNAADNIFAGRELRRGPWLDRRAMNAQARALLRELGEELPLDTPVGGFSLAQRQAVALARALHLGSKLLILDEPTASLSGREAAAVHRIVRQLRDRGLAVLYVSHRLEEVFALADRVTVLRDGETAATGPIGEWTPERLIQTMVGREVADSAASSREPGPVVLEVSSVRGISLAVRAGEILGIGGLVGAGRSELARAVFGLDPRGGVVRVAGTLVPSEDPGAAMAAGIALVPEDRRHEGLLLPFSIAENVALADLASIRGSLGLDPARERALGNQAIADYGVRAPGPDAAAATLSGGNQQKVVLAKWLGRSPKVLILDEPTRGIDVGAKAEVHRLIERLADTGTAVVLISSDLPELLALSSRVLVLREGRAAGTVERAEATPERVLALALPDGGGA